VPFLPTSDEQLPWPMRANAVAPPQAGEPPELSTLEPAAEIKRKLTSSRFNLVRPFWIE
jgi:hypothetical protein